MIDKYKEAAMGGNIMQALRLFNDEEKREIMRHYYLLAVPIKSNCSTATQEDMFIIDSMTHAYNSMPEVKYGLRSSACALANNLALVGKYLRGLGLVE